MNAEYGPARAVQSGIRKAVLDRAFDPRSAFVFIGLLVAGVLFVAYSLYADVDASGTRTTAFLPYALLFVALLIALGFEFVNGFHDTANALATVIYTHSLPAQLAVVWSGSFNFLGVLLSSGAVAFGIISLLPVELILQVGSSAGFAMVFALLIAAIIWNLGTLNRALPDSQIAAFLVTSSAASDVIEEKAAGFNVLGDPRPAVARYVSQHKIDGGTYPSLAVLVRDIAAQVKQYGSLAKIPAEAVGNTRNDMYLTSEALRYLMKDRDSDLSEDDVDPRSAFASRDCRRFE